MVCTSPTYIYYLYSGKKLVLRDEYLTKTRNQLKEGVNVKSYEKVGCGKCLSCRISKAKEWSVRCIQELKFHKKSCFLTLTYDPQNINEDFSLVKADMTSFIKRLRYYYPNVKIQYLQCGEYGSLKSRPHHHMILYGLDFKEDRKIFQKTHQNNILYKSKTLDSIWGNGMCIIGDVTLQSIQYVCRYTLKKKYGNEAKKHYKNKIPEYITSSKRPSIGKKFYDMYKFTDIYPHDYCILNGKKYKVPKYYDRLLEKENPDLLEILKTKRKEFAIKLEKTKEELYQINEVLQSRLSKLIRTYELQL